MKLNAFSLLVSFNPNPNLSILECVDETLVEVGVLRVTDCSGKPASEEERRVLTCSGKLKITTVFGFLDVDVFGNVHFTRRVIRSYLRGFVQHLQQLGDYSML